MRLNLSNENMFLLALSTFFLVIVLVFSFLVLLPKAKKYREQTVALKTATLQLEKYKTVKNKSLTMLKKLQSDNKDTLKALKTSFSVKKFRDCAKGYFTDIAPLKVVDLGKNSSGFYTYELNISSSVSSPKEFYRFVRDLNKNGWIAEIHPPVRFKKGAKNIELSFGVKIYTAS